MGNLSDLPNEVILQIAFFLTIKQETYNINPQIFGHFSSFAKINHDLVSLSSTCKSLRKLLSPTLFKFISLVRKSEKDTFLKVRENSKQNKWANDFQNELNFLHSVEFLEISTARFLETTNIALPKLQCLKLFSFMNDEPRYIADRPKSKSKISIQYLSLEIKDKPTITHILHKLNFDNISRLDIFLDFAPKTAVKDRFESLKEISNKYTIETDSNSPSLKELLIISRTFALALTVDKINQFISTFSASLQKLSIASASNSGTATSFSSFEQAAIQLGGECNSDFFFATLRQIPKLKKLSIDLSIVKRLMGAEIPATATLSSISTKQLDNQKTAADLPQFCLEVLEPSSIVYPAFLKQYKKCLVNFIHSLPFQIHKLIFNYQKQIEQIFQTPLISWIDILSQLYLNHHYKVQLLQLNWVWSTIDTQVIEAFDSYYRTEAEKDRSKIFVPTPIYASVDGTSPDFRWPELYKADYGLLEQNWAIYRNHSDEHESPLLFISDVDEGHAKEAWKHDLEFWSQLIASNDLPYYSRNQERSSIWD